MDCNAYSVKPLPYDYNALEPYLNEETMRVHHDVLYKRYVDNLNATLKDYPQLCGLSYEQLILMAPSLPQEIATSVYNFAGGAYNHEQYFEMMSPQIDTQPSGTFLETINYTYGNFDNFKKELKQQAMSVFGSGYSWVAIDELGRLEIINMANQTTPFSFTMYPIIPIDVWEHAYFLQYLAARSDYIDAWLRVANWERASQKFNGEL